VFCRFTDLSCLEVILPVAELAGVRI